MAVISLGGTVVSTSIKVAGDNFDEAIMRYVRKMHNLMIGERTAEDIKIQIGTVYSLLEPKSMEVKGRDTITGLPKSITVTSEEIREALKDAATQIMETIHSILEKTPPELAADVAERGIVLTGGGALLGGLGTAYRRRNRDQYSGGRGTCPGCCHRNRSVYGTYEQDEREIKEDRTEGKNCGRDN